MEITKEYITELYINKNLSLKEISNILSCSKATVHRIIIKFGIIKNKEKAQESRYKNFKKTCLKKYGVENHFFLEEFQEKAQNSILKKFGVRHVSQNLDILEKIKLTTVEKYGCFPASKSEIVKNKMASTNINKYGVKSPLALEDIQEKSESVVNNKYGVKRFMKSLLFNEKVYEKYNVKNISENLDIKIKKYNTRINTGNLLLINNKSVSEWAKEHSIPQDYLYKNINQDLSESHIKSIINSYKNNISDIERILSNQFSINRYNLKIKNSDLNYRPDFKFSDKLYLNVDGLYWHSEINLESKYHFNMRKKYEENNLRILQFRENEIKNKVDIITSIINNLFNKSIKCGARQFNIRKIKTFEAKNFLDCNHLKGYKPARHIGLVNKNNDIYMILSYKIIKNQLKVERLCSRLGYNIAGGFSRLLKYVESLEKGKFSEIHYWVDLRYGTGKFLEQFGFKQNKETLGWEWTDFKQTYNRLSCRANMDNRKLTEKEYAAEKKWYKIYDAGQRLYIKT